MRSVRAGCREKVTESGSSRVHCSSSGPFCSSWYASGISDFEEAMAALDIAWIVGDNVMHQRHREVADHPMRVLTSPDAILVSVLYPRRTPRRVGARRKFHVLKIR